MTEFSVILPLRNQGQYLQECIHSILSQTYTNFELIILAHDSDEATLACLNSLTEPRIKMIYAENIDGIAGNWARIKNVAKKEFMTIIGYDDIFKPRFLQTIDELIRKYPEASLYHTHFDFIDADGKVIRQCKPMPEKLSQDELLAEFLKGTIDAMGTGYVMRSADYESVGGISATYPNLLFADFDLWLQLAGLKYEVIATENCFSFRVHQSVTSSSSDAKLHEGLGTFINFLAALKLQQPTTAAVIHKHGGKFLLRYAKSYSHRILRTPKNKRNEISVKRFISYTRQLATLLNIDSNYLPEKEKSIKLAGIIDRSKLLSTLFLIVRSRYGKPFKT